MTTIASAPTESLLPRRDLSLDFDEPDGLQYLDTPLHVTAQREAAGDVRFDVHVDHEPLDGDLLVSLLGRITASKTVDDSLRGIIADWNVVDRAKDEKGSLAKRLVELHEHLGESWGQFMASRGQWLSLLIDSDVPIIERSRGAYRWSTPSPFLAADKITLDTLAQGIAADGTHTLETLVQILKDAGIPGAQEIVLEKAAATLNSKRHPGRQLENADSIARHFACQSRHNRESTTRSVLTGFDEEARATVYEAGRDLLYEAFESATGKQLYVSKARLARPLSDVLSEAQTVRRGHKEAEVALFEFADRKTQRVIIPGSLRRVEPPRVVAPLLSWRRGEDGSRQFVIERGTDHLGAQTVFRDGILGIMFAAYMAPEVTDEWPARMRIRGSRKQSVGVAQVPVLALMRQGQLLKSDFIDAAEEAVDPTDVKL